MNERKAPSPLSTCKGRTRSKKAKWKAQHERNRVARANLNREYKGEKDWRTPKLYHAALDALSGGTYGN